MVSTYFWIIISAILSGISIATLKQYTITKNIRWLLLTVVLFLILIVTYHNSFCGNDITTIYPMVKILTVRLVVLFGVFIFDEKLTIKHIFGLMLGCIGLYLLSS